MGYNPNISHNPFTNQIFTTFLGHPSTQVVMVNRHLFRLGCLGWDFGGQGVEGYALQIPAFVDVFPGSHCHHLKNGGAFWMMINPY